MQSSAQEVTMLFKLIAAAKDSWACFVYFEGSAKQVNLMGSMTKKSLDLGVRQLVNGPYISS